MNLDTHQLVYQDTVIPGNYFIDDLTFDSIRVVNRGEIDLQNFKIGLGKEYSLGSKNDSHIGCDTRINTSFAFNVDNFVEGVQGFSLNSPAQGVFFEPCHAEPRGLSR